MSVQAEQKLEKLPYQVHPSNSKPTYYIITPPARQLIRYYNDYYDIPFPYVVFDFENFNTPSGARPYLHGVYATKSYSPDRKLYVSYLPLPNMYRGRPCISSTMYDHRVRTDAVDIINTFWQERFSRDGRLANIPAWKWLADSAGVGPRDRRSVLKYWETLSVDQVLLSLPLNQSVHLS